MDKEKCGSKKRVKRGFNNKKQRYLCKCCGCRYTVGQRGYPEHIRRKAIQLYLEGNGFRQIETILSVSHVSVINWVKKAGAKLEKAPKKDEKVEIVELNELYAKKHLTLDLNKPHTSKNFRIKLVILTRNFMHLTISMPTISSIR